MRDGRCDHHGLLRAHSKASAFHARVRMHETSDDADRARAWALYGNAIAAHDKALATFLGSLHAAGRDDDTAIFVTSDVAPDESSHVPFGDSEPLDERALSLPLIVRVPGEGHGLHSAAPTSALDIAPTIFGSLGLSSPTQFQGTSVLSPEHSRPRLATVGNKVSAQLHREKIAEEDRQKILDWGKKYSEAGYDYLFQQAWPKDGPEGNLSEMGSYGMGRAYELCMKLEALCGEGFFRNVFHYMHENGVTFRDSKTQAARNEILIGAMQTQTDKDLWAFFAAEGFKY